MAKSLPVEEVSHTHDGHTLNPGDPVIAVTCGMGRASLVYGKYLGKRNGNVVMEVVRHTTKFEHKETGDQYDWAMERVLNPYPRSPNDWRDAEKVAAYNDACKAYQQRNAELRADYVNNKYPYKARTTLQLNKIYPADVALRDVTL